MDYAVIYFKVELGLYNIFQEAWIYGSNDGDNANDDDSTTPTLCQMNVAQLESDTSYYTDMNSRNDSTECPFPGSYLLTAYYKVPAIADYTFHYTPDVRLQFLNTQGQRIGCVVTGPAALHHIAEIKAKHGLLALIIAISIFLLLFAILLHLSHRRKKRLETLWKQRSNSNSNHHRQQQQHPLTQQQQQQHNQQQMYVRTLPNGQVPALPQQRRGAGVVGPCIPEASNEDAGSEEEDDDENHDILNISNPAYNETHVPTRPII